MQALAKPQFSIQARSIGFNAFVLSVMPYTMVFLGLTWKDFNLLRQAAVKLNLQRHWLEAEIMPYVLTYLGVATVLDPGLAATTAAIGLFLRSGGLVGDLITEVGPPGNSRPAVVARQFLHLWQEYVPVEKMINALYTPGIGSLEKAIVAKKEIRNDVYKQGWPGGVCSDWLEIMADLPKTWFNSISRFAVLRWAFGEDDEYWLTVRGTRHQHRCAGCGSQADCFPWGDGESPLCDRCAYRQEASAFSLNPVSDRIPRHLGIISQSEERAHPEGLVPAWCSESAHW